MTWNDHLGELLDDPVAFIVFVENASGMHGFTSKRVGAPPSDALLDFAATTACRFMALRELDDAKALRDA